MLPFSALAADQVSVVDVLLGTYASPENEISYHLKLANHFPVWKWYT